MKKLTSLMLCLLMLFTTVLSTSALTNNTTIVDMIDDGGFILGDANGDGSVDMKDSLCIRQYCAGVGSVDENSSDINADGKINAKDLLILKKCNAKTDNLANYDSQAYVDYLTIAGNSISEYSIVYP